MARELGHTPQAWAQALLRLGAPAAVSGSVVDVDGIGAVDVPDAAVALDAAAQACVARETDVCSAWLIEEITRSMDAEDPRLRIRAEPGRVVISFHNREV